MTFFTFQNVESGFMNRVAITSIVNNDIVGPPNDKNINIHLLWLLFSRSLPSRRSW